MRNIKRIEPFMKALAIIWQEKCPDWRFGQLMTNVLNSFDTDPFFIEEDEMLERFKNFFESNKENDKCNRLH